MKRQTLLVRLALLLLASFACRAPTENTRIAPPPSESGDPAPPADWLAAYAGYVQTAMENDGIPGLALAVVQGDEIVLAVGYGLRDVAAQAPVTPETLFHIGSVHKSMTAMMIATLVDEGALGWDEPVVTFAPAFALSDPEATQAVTMRHLLSMRAGIPDDAEDDLDVWASVEEIFAVIREAPLLGMPGERFSYSNLSASAAGYLGVIASGEAGSDLHTGYAQLLQEHVLDPIGMTTATIYVSEARERADVARSYTLSRRGDPVLSASYDVDQDALAPAGSLKANVTEMALYVATQLNHGVAPNGSRVVSAENLTETWRPYLEDYAMGWDVQTHEGVTVISHTGAYDDFASVIGFLPELDVGFVILLNCEEAGEALVEDAPYVLVETLSRY